MGKQKFDTIASHIKEVTKLYKEVKKLLPDFEAYELDKAFDDKQYMKLVNLASIMLTKDIDTTPYRDANKNLITPIKMYCFIDSGINRNGIDSTGRIGRTYSISYYTRATVKPYRCQREYKNEVNKFYQYKESIQELVDTFEFFLKVSKNNEKR